MGFHAAFHCFLPALLAGGQRARRKSCPRLIMGRHFMRFNRWPDVFRQPFLSDHQEIMVIACHHLDPMHPVIGQRSFSLTDFTAVDGVI